MSLIQVEPGESIQAVLAVDDWEEEQYVVMATKNGIVKKTALSDFDTPRTGIIAINLDEDDEMVGAKLTDGRRDLLLATKFGQAIRFAEEDVRPMGRAARGVKGITLDGEDEVVGMEVVRDGADLLVVTTNGFGKRTLLEEYRRIGRGGKGVKTLQRTEKTGLVAGIKVVDEDDEVVLITEAGVMIRINVDDISRQGRSTQGVTLMRLDEDDRVIALAIARMEDVDDE